MFLWCFYERSVQVLMARDEVVNQVKTVVMNELYKLGKFVSRV